MSYMVNQSSIVGLDVTPLGDKLNQDQSEARRPTYSMTWFRWILNSLRQLAHKGSVSMTRYVNCVTNSNVSRSNVFSFYIRGRVIKRGQRVHASVCFMPRSYEPKATFAPEIEEEISWSDIVGIALVGNNVNWGFWRDETRMEEFIERGIFDISTIPDLIQQVVCEPNNHDLSGHLAFVASTGTSQSILS